jgi:tetratricopeptide (TPR) repeat protein
MPAIEEVRRRAVGALAQQLDSVFVAPQLLSPPPSLEVYQEYMKGLDAFYLPDFEKARPHFYRALELDSSYVIVLHDLAYTYANLGDYATADSLIRVLEGHRAQLSPFEQVDLDVTRAALDGDVEAEYRAAKRRLQLNPGGGVYTAAWSAVRSNRPHEAAELLSTRGPVTRYEQQWPYWWIVSADALHMSGQYEKELAVAREARAAHPDHEGHFLSAEAGALAALGRLDELEEVLDEISSLPFASLDTGPPHWMRFAATELRAHGHEEAVSAVLDRIDAIVQSPLLRERAGDPPSRNYRYQLGVTHYYAERYSEALPFFESLLRPDRWQYMGWIGATYARLGEREKALEYSDQLGALEGMNLRGAHHIWQARIAAVLGERERAVNLLEQALSSGANYLWNQFHRQHVIDLWLLHDYPPFQELMRPKG